MATNNEDNLAKFRQSMVWNERSTIRAKFSRLSIPKFIFHSIHAYRISLQVNHSPFRYFPTRNSTPSIVFQLPANVDSSPTWNNNWFESFQAYIHTFFPSPRSEKPISNGEANSWNRKNNRETWERCSQWSIGENIRPISRCYTVVERNDLSSPGNMTRQWRMAISRAIIQQAS